MNGMDICSALGGLLNTLAEDVKALKEWKGEAELLIQNLHVDGAHMRKVTEEAQLRHIRAQQGLMKTQSALLFAKLGTALRREYFMKLRTFAEKQHSKAKRIARRNEHASIIFRSTRNGSLQIYFKKLYSFFRTKKAFKDKVKKQVMLLDSSEEVMRHSFFAMWVRFHRKAALRRMCVERLSHATQTGYFMVYFREWYQYSLAKQRNKVLMTSVQTLCFSSERGLQSNAFRKLRKYVALVQQRNQIAQQQQRRHSMRLRALSSLLSSTTRGRLLFAYKMWVSFGQKREKRHFKELIQNITAQITRGSKETNERIEKMKEMSDEVAGQGREVKAMVSPLQKNLDEAQRTLLFISDQFKTVRDEHHSIRAESDAALREAMDEVDQVLSQTRDTMHQNSLKTETSMQEHSQVVDMTVNDRMRQLEVTMADMLSQDRDAVRKVVEGVKVSLDSRIASLASQSDVSLKSLSNTNTVLNKIVDRMITVDKQIERLGRGGGVGGGGPPSAGRGLERSGTALPEPRDISPERKDHRSPGLQQRLF